MTERPTVALLDADLFVYRIGFASEDADEVIAKSRLTEWLTDIVYMDLKCVDYKAYITGSGNFRNDIAVTQPYKGNRSKLTKPKHYAALREHLKRMGAVVVEGMEADDAVGIESTRGNYWIVHQDKDLNQLPGWHYSPTKCLEYFVEPFEGLRSFYTQVLTGDVTDHIPGLWKVGPKTAEKILKDCKTEDDLCRATFETYVSKGHTKEYFLEQARLLWLRREEGQIWEAPIDI